MNSYVHIWGDWLSCDPLRPITPYKETLVPHLVTTLIYLSQTDLYYVRGDRSPLSFPFVTKKKKKMHEHLALK